MKINKKLIFSLLFFSTLFFAGNASAAGIIPCGGSGQEKCTICYLIIGFNGVISTMLKLSFLVALAVLAFASVWYISSAGDSGMIGTAKGAIKNSVIGIIVMFSAWIIVNYTMQLLGTKQDLGIMYVGGWDKFQCEARVVNTSGSNSSVPGSSASAPPAPAGTRAPLEGSCGNNNAGKCMDTTMTLCPSNFKHLYGGKSCEWGLGCCISNTSPDTSIPAGNQR